MARIDQGTTFTSGTVGGATYYQMNGKQYVRAKSSLSRKRVLKDKAFENTRRCASDLGKAAQIGSLIYHELPDEIKVHWMYRAITGEAVSMLYDDYTPEEVEEFLWKKYITDTGAEEKRSITRSSFTKDNSAKKTTLKLREIFCKRWESQGKSYYYFKKAWQKRSFFNRQTFHEYLAIADRLQSKMRV
jgi:hypothetical protein